MECTLFYYPRCNKTCLSLFVKNSSSKQQTAVSLPNTVSSFFHVMIERASRIYLCIKVSIVRIVVNWKKLTLLYKLMVYFTYPTISLVLWLSLVEQLQPKNTNNGNSVHVVDAESSEIVLTAVCRTVATCGHVDLRMRSSTTPHSNGVPKIRREMIVLSLDS